MNKPLFDKCPHCGLNPFAVGTKPITIGDRQFEEWYCGDCGKCVGTTPMPTGPVPSTRHAQSQWNFLVKKGTVQ